jgi:hypothetical protein
MTEDINLSGFEQLNSIGYFTGNFTSMYNEPFAGVFDGDGHRISNLVCRYEGTDNLYGLALFSYVEGENAEIKNLGICDPCVYGNSKAEQIGALAGTLIDGRITNCYVVGGSVHGDKSYVGGLVGNNGGILSNCSVKGCTVSGDSGITGAITGMNGGEIESCFAKASVNGGGRIGGLVGVNKGIIGHSYSQSDIIADSIAGGLAGENWDDISYCYSASTVDADSDIGAFVGENMLSYQYSKCFWDSDLNPGLSGMSDESDPNVIGLPTPEMQKRATFADAGWDMVNVWDIGENQTYPFLRAHLPSDINKDGETNLYDLAILALNWLEEY